MSELKGKDVGLYQRTIFNMTLQPVDEAQGERIETVRNAYKRAVGIIYQNCPWSRERAVAITNLEDSLMWAVAAIAREGD